MIIPTREASKIQQIHTLLVDQGFRISVGREGVSSLGFANTRKKQLERRKNPVEKTHYLFLAAKMKKAEASGMGTILLREFTEGSLLISSSSNCPSSSETVGPRLVLRLALLTCFSS